MFRMNGTPRAQDAQERCVSVLHAVRAGKRTTAGMQEVEPRRSSCRGAVCVSYAHCLGFNMGAKVAWSLIQDMPQAHPCGRGLDFLSRTVLNQGPHPLGSVGHLKSVVSGRYAQRMAEAGLEIRLSETITL